MTSMGKMKRLWRVGWPENAPLRDYMWGVAMLAMAVLTIIGLIYMFGG